MYRRGWSCKPREIPLLCCLPHLSECLNTVRKSPCCHISVSFYVTHSLLTIRQGKRFAFNWLGPTNLPTSLCVPFIYISSLKGWSIPLQVLFCQRNGFAVITPHQHSLRPACPQSLPSTICLYYLIAVSFSFSCYYDMSTGLFWLKSTQNAMRRGRGGRLLIFKWETSLGWYPWLRAAIPRLKTSINAYPIINPRELYGIMTHYRQFCDSVVVDLSWSRWT